MQVKEIIKDSGYYVTDTGNVITTNYCKGTITKILKPRITNSGYKAIYISKYKKAYYIHRLVAEAFIPNPYNKKQVNHKDLNKMNNHVNNLEWVNQEENCNHYRSNVYNTKGKTSGHSGTLYKNGNTIMSFRSLQQAKLFCKRHYNCTLSTNSTINENIKHNLVYLRDNENISIDSYLQKLRDRKKLNKEKNKIKNKAEKGYTGTLYKDNKPIKKFNSIREAETFIGHVFRKKKDNTYKTCNYIYIRNVW